MATFNPELEKQQPPSFLNYSRGWKDDSVGDLMGGVANLFTAGVKAKDDHIKREIKDEARVRVDETNDRSIAELHSVTRAGAPPTEIAQRTRELQKWKQAVEQGSARESNYWGALDSTARMLRARYPGYRDHIDDTLKELTGSVPANALVRSLRQDYQTLTSGNKDPYGDMIKTMSGEGTLPRDWQNSEKWTYDNLISWRGQVMRDKFDVAQRNATLTLAGKQGEIDQKAAAGNARTEWYGILRGEGEGRTIFEQANKFSELAGSFSGSQDLTPEQERAVRDEGKRTIDAIKAGYQAFINKPNRIGAQSYAQYVGDEGLAPLKKQVDDTIKDITEAMYNKDYGSAYRAAQNVRAYSDSTKRHLMDDPTVRALNGAREVLGPEVMGELLTNAKNRSAVHRAVAEAATVRMAAPHINGGPTSLIAQLTEAQNKGEGDPKLYQAIIDDALTAVSHKDTKPEARQALVDSLYGDRNAAFLNFTRNDKDPAHMHKVFNTMSNPKAARAIWQASQDTGDPTLWNKYQKWTINQTYALNALDINTVSKAQLDAIGVDIKFNSDTMSFSVIPKNAEEWAREARRMQLPGAMGEEGLGPRQALLTVAMEQYRTSGIEATVNRLNASFAPLREVAKLNGGNKDQFMSTVLYEMNLKAMSNPARYSQAEPWFGALNRAVDKGVDTWARLWAERNRGRMVGTNAIEGIREGAQAADRTLTDISGRFGPETQFPDTNPDRNIVSPQTRTQMERMWNYFSGLFPTREQADRGRNRTTLGAD